MQTIREHVLIVLLLIPLFIITRLIQKETVMSRRVVRHTENRTTASMEIRLHVRHIILVVYLMDQACTIMIILTAVSSLL